MVSSGSEHDSGSERDSSNCSGYGSGDHSEYGSARERDNASDSEYSGTQRREVTVVQCLCEGGLLMCGCEHAKCADSKGGLV